MRPAAGSAVSITDPLHEFQNHVASLRQVLPSRRGDGFDDEFDRLQREEKKGDLQYARQQTSANRYANILPYEHTRVKLKVIGDEEGTDYINANYIKLSNNEKTYIATQAPLPSTFPQFWRMIWEQHTRVIVMLTRETENDRTKCDRYWPEPNQPPHTYGTIVVRCIESGVMANVPGLHKRVFKISRSKVSTPRPEMMNDRDEAEREVVQYQFIGWPDHSVPSGPTGTQAIRQLVRLVDEAWRAGVDVARLNASRAEDASAPITVHCSAGVGRTGAFIAIHHELRKLRQYLDLHRQRSLANHSNAPLLSAASASAASARPPSASSLPPAGSGALFTIYKTVSAMRESRPGMVQQREQYKFIYDTVLEEGAAMFAAPHAPSPQTTPRSHSHHESGGLAPALSAPAALARSGIRPTPAGDPMET
eukprot:tig00000144_g9172.t1